MKYENELIFCIVNAGFSEAVMDAARQFGARGGTVIRARGTANPEAEKIFNIKIQPEKEIVLILCKKELKDGIMHGLYWSVGLATNGHGIAFSLPVDGVVGIKDFEQVDPDGKSSGGESGKNAADKTENRSADV